MANTTIINKFGTLTGWSRITVNILGRDVEGITQIAYADEEEIEKVFGAGKFPIGYGEGNYDAVISMTLIKEELDAIQASLGSGKRLQDIEPFPVYVEYALNNGQILKDVIHNVKFKGRGMEANQNDKMISNQPPLICSHIDYGVAA